MQKFYFHDAATGNTGTLPAGEHSASTASVTATGANTQRSMDDTIGVSQTSIALTTLANTSAQPCLFRMFESLPLAAQTIAAGNWQLSLAGSEANANSNLHFTACVYAWRPGTGAVVGSLIFDLAAASTGEPGTSEAALSDTTISGGSVTVSAGDILICEIWRDATVQGNATARVNTFFYDGTTEASAASNAAFLLAPADIPLNNADSPGLELSSFGSFSEVGAGDTINHVTVSVTHHEAAGSMAPTWELWDAASAQIDSTQTGTASTSDHADSHDFTGITYSQIGTLRVRIYGHAFTGQATSVDAATIVVNYTAAAAAALPDVNMATRIAP